MTELISKAKEQINTIEQLFDDFKELAQNRSDYALVKHVITTHDMPGRQRKQVQDELMGIMQGLNQMVAQYELAKLDIADLEKEEGQRAAIQLRSKKIEVELLEVQLLGLERECNTLLNLLNNMPVYTKETFESEEETYWIKRLTRQFFMMDRAGGNAGNLDAIHQLFGHPGTPRLGVPVSVSDIMATLGYEVDDKQIKKDDPLILQSEDR